jgi:hypothetical protein
MKVSVRYSASVMPANKTALETNTNRRARVVSNPVSYLEVLIFVFILQAEDIRGFTWFLYKNARYYFKMGHAELLPGNILQPVLDPEICNTDRRESILPPMK